jgi:fluoride exporter
MKHLWIGLAGAAGALSRYLLGTMVTAFLPLPFPLGTFVINVTGSFFLGLVAALGADRGLIPPQWRTPIGIGFIGAYTTFSTWTVDTVQLLEHGDFLTAGANVVGSLLFGMFAVWAGLRLGHRRLASRNSAE